MTGLTACKPLADELYQPITVQADVPAQLRRVRSMSDDQKDDRQAPNDDSYRYDEDAEGHENQLEFDRDYATYDVLERKGLINPELEEKIREDLEQDMPGRSAAAGDEDQEKGSSQQHGQPQ